jgi:hypothetical protein
MSQEKFEGDASLTNEKYPAVNAMHLEGFMIQPSSASFGWELRAENAKHR